MNSASGGHVRARSKRAPAALLRHAQLPVLWKVSQFVTAKFINHSYFKIARWSANCISWLLPAPLKEQHSLHVLQLAMNSRPRMKFNDTHRTSYTSRLFLKLFRLT
jgi:hypothetical protein